MKRLIQSDQDLKAHIAELANAVPVFAPIVEVAGDVPLRWLDGGFKGLVWVVVGQQISVAAGRAIFGRLETAVGTVSPEGLAATGDAELRTAGLSAPKSSTWRALQAAADDGNLDVTALHDLPPQTAIETLCAIKGVGPWTAQVYLLFAAGHPDIFPAADVALQESARLAFELDERPGTKDLQAMSEAWSPWRSAGARLLWAYYRVRKGGKTVTPV